MCAAAAALLHLAMVLGGDVHKLLDVEQRRAVLHQILEKVLQVHRQQLHRLLVQRREAEHRAEPHEQAQQMERAVNGGHWFVRILFEYFGVLGSLEFVQQLAAEHHVKVLDEAGGHVGDGHLLVLVEGFAVLLVKDVGVDDVLHGGLGRYVEQFLLPIDGVPVVDQPRLEVVGYLDFDLHLGDELLLRFDGGRVQTTALFPIEHKMLLFVFAGNTKPHRTHFISVTVPPPPLVWLGVEADGLLARPRTLAAAAAAAPGVDVPPVSGVVVAAVTVELVAVVAAADELLLVVGSLSSSLDGVDARESLSLPLELAPSDFFAFGVAPNGMRLANRKI